MCVTFLRTDVSFHKGFELDVIQTEEQPTSLVPPMGQNFNAIQSA